MDGVCGSAVWNCVVDAFGCLKRPNNTTNSMGSKLLSFVAVN
jgi:hypothetical protein